jgi:hypothetical protein
MPRKPPCRFVINLALRDGEHERGSAMYCPQCGTNNGENDAFCKRCGGDLRKYKEQWSASAGGTAQAGNTGAGSPSGSPPPDEQQYQPGYQAPPYQTGTGHPSGGYAPGGYYPPAGYYRPATYPPAYGYSPIPRVPSYLGWAIATLILCFLPTGIVAVVYATRVDNRLSFGDVAGAEDASRKARMWCWISFGIGVAKLILGIILFLLLIVATVRTGTYDYF